MIALKKAQSWTMLYSIDQGQIMPTCSKSEYQHQPKNNRLEELYLSLNMQTDGVAQYYHFLELCKMQVSIVELFGVNQAAASKKNSGTFVRPEWTTIWLYPRWKETAAANAIGKSWAHLCEGNAQEILTKQRLSQAS